MKKSLCACLCLSLLLLLPACSTDLHADITLINASYDPTREFYEAYNEMFAAYWSEQSGQSVEIVQSHAGSGSQALAVANGLPADVVTLALEADINSIQSAGLLDTDWLSEFPNDSSPYTSTIVFLVRSGNPKQIKDWADLIRSDVEIITPNPKTSGAARWIFLAAWAWAEKEYDADDAAIRAYIGQLYRNVIVLSSGARGSTTTFCENGQGDVLLSWENEAYLTMEAYPGEYQIISPSLSILCQPSVAIVDEVVAYHDTEELAEAYLSYLYSDEAQRLAGQYYYRPANSEILQEFAEVFDLDMELTDIAHFGGWENAQAFYFADGGVFDQIYE